MQSTDVQARRRVLRRREGLVRLPMPLASDAAAEAWAPVRFMQGPNNDHQDPEDNQRRQGYQPNIAKTNNAVFAFWCGMSNTARTNRT